ncbi:MAG: lipoprotein [Betaproteobacteria bacterium]|nr:lipoprotein [Betaproteobacteria bacterium]
MQLTACGLKGPLYLPKPVSAPSSPPSAQSAPSSDLSKPFPNNSPKQSEP